MTKDRAIEMLEKLTPKYVVVGVVHDGKRQLPVNYEIDERVCFNEEDLREILSSGNYVDAKSMKIDGMSVKYHTEEKLKGLKEREENAEERAEYERLKAKYEK